MVLRNGCLARLYGKQHDAGLLEDVSHFDEIPDDDVERAEMMEGILPSRATGGAADNGIYVQLRRDFMADPNTRDLLPKFVRTYRNLDAF